MGQYYRRPPDRPYFDVAAPGVSFALVLMIAFGMTLSLATSSYAQSRGTVKQAFNQLLPIVGGGVWDRSEELIVRLDRVFSR